MSLVKKSYKLFTYILNDNCTILHRAILKPNVLSIKNKNIHTTRYLEAIVSFNLSDIGEGIRDVIVKEWFVKIGDKVSQFDNICEVQSDKASVTITSRYDGVIKKLYHQIDQVALVGKPLIDIEIDGDNEKSSSSSSSSEDEISDEEKPKLDVFSSPTIEDVSTTTSTILCIPSVRRLAKEHSVNLSDVTPTGKKGRILKEDVLNHLQSKAEVATEKLPEIKPVFNQERTDKTVAITPFQRGMIKTMTEALKIPHFLYCDEVIATKLKKLHQSVREEVQKSDIKLSLMPFFIKAASNALLRYPILNATLDANCENLTYRRSHNLGIAMDTKAGLAVPVIKDVDQLSVVQIAKELNRLMKMGKEGQLTMNDLKGGTFTISNIGIIGGTYTSPIILPPQVAIIAIGAVKTVPRFDDSNNVIAEDVFCISGAGDHRIVDGATMANFVNQFKKQIEDPNLLLLNL